MKLPCLRLLTEADLAFADSLRALAGWNQTLADWKRFLTLEPDGCFLAEWGGVPAGTATTITYGCELAWIGMVLVHPNFRRRGIGQALLERCLTCLRERGIRCIKLDATPDGEKVYAGLGFQAEWTLTRWERIGAPLIAPETGARVRSWEPDDAAAIEAFDVSAFGVSRRRLIENLVASGGHHLVSGSGFDDVTGYGFSRPGSRASYLGPVAAECADSAGHLIEALLAGGTPDRIFWDIPDLNTAAVGWASGHGFTRQRPLTRMFLGENRVPGEPQKQFAIAGPEVG